MSCWRPEWSTSQYVPPRPVWPESVSHSSAMTDPATFTGKRVAVIGRGQSALESAALLSENGAEVEIITRSPAVVWNGPPLPPDRPLLQRLREPEAGLGSGWGTWFYSRHPGLFRHLPERTRMQRRAPHSARPGPAGCAIGSRARSRSGPASYLLRATPDGVAAGTCRRDGRERRTPRTTSSRPPATGRTWAGCRSSALSWPPGCAPSPAPRSWTATTSPPPRGCT